MFPASGLITVCDEIRRGLLGICAKLHESKGVTEVVRWEMGLAVRLYERLLKMSAFPARVRIWGLRAQWD